MTTLVTKKSQNEIISKMSDQEVLNLKKQLQDKLFKIIPADRAKLQ